MSSLDPIRTGGGVQGRFSGSRREEGHGTETGPSTTSSDGIDGSPDETEVRTGRERLGQEHPPLSLGSGDLPKILPTNNVLVGLTPDISRRSLS